MSAPDCVEKSRWIEGPTFLCESQDEWPKQEKSYSSNRPLPGEKKIRVNTQVMKKENGGILC